MKMLLVAVAVATLVSLVRTQATVITVDGALSWNITEPRCSFQLKGNLKNSTALSSGPLKLVLWATPYPFPSPGYIVAEYSLGSIAGGYQFSNFTVKTPSKVPSVSGPYYFTIAIAEYNGASWRNVASVPTGQRNLQVGNFVGQKKWLIPAAQVLPPVGLLTAGTVFRLSLKATGENNLFPPSLQEKSMITVSTKTQLKSTLRSVERSGKYSYAARFGKFGKRKVDFGQLTINYSGKNKGSSKAVYSFYFQSLTGGTYRCVETNGSSQETTWGTFE
jgi:hypothetical protein